MVRVITKSGTGSGMIIDKAGYVLTNSHVIEGNETMTVVLSDGRRLPASTVGRDEITDLAILRISSENLPVVTLGDSDRLGQGEEVIAIGYPLDLAGSATVSRGIVSAFRSIDGVDYIQTDAAINPGNSGGPLLKLSGEVIGIASYTYTYAKEGMNLAITINSALPLIPKLIAGVSVLKPTPTPAPWKTYTDNTYGYSVQYPPTWRLVDGGKSTDARFVLVAIIGPGSSSIIIDATSLNDIRPGLTSMVDSKVLARSKSEAIYRVLSRKDLLWQGVYQACELTNIDQWGPGDPLRKSKSLYIIDGYFYQISGYANESEYELYSATIDRIIVSFRITN